MDFIKGIQGALKGELPGNRAHQRMISYSRPSAEAIRASDKEPRLSAVMILFYRENGEWYFPLIKRQAYPGVHSRQISLPGGQYEEEDEDLKQTSIRETEEELGISSDTLEVIGKLSDIYIPPSNFLVEPYIGYIDGPLSFDPDEVEVERVIPTSLRDFANMDIEKDEREIRDGKLRIMVNSFRIDNEVVWGATAMMLSELQILINENDLKITNDAVR